MSCGCGAPRKASCCCPAPPPTPDKGCCAGMMLCDTAPNGMVTPFVRIYQDGDCATDLTIAGKPYSTMGMVAPCTEDQTDGCDTTTPASVVGLCRADGTPIVVVVQRNCDGVVSAPGWVNLPTGVYTAGVVPVDAAPCDAVTPMATGLTLVDGTPITVVSQRDGAGTVSQVGWVDATTGVFTAGNPPATARAGGDAEPDLVVLCDTAANGTVTSFVRNYERNRAGDVTGFADHTLTGAAYAPTGDVGACDPDTPITATGMALSDGTPITVVSQRDRNGVTTQTGWLNVTTGVFTAGPPPVGVRAPGDAEPDLVVLCDITGDTVTSFVRNYERNRAGDVVGFTDHTLSGAPYVPTGDVGACDATPPCDTTTPISTTGLCLADGTPIAVVSVRDCDGVIAQPGWIRLGTGVFTAGPPPAGARPCGSTDVETQVLCLVDAGGVVLSQVIAEYGYATGTGERLFQRFTNPTTGAAVVPPVGATVQECPKPRDVEVVCMSDSNPPAGLLRRFFRHYVYAPDGSVQSTFDTDWDGTPYVPTGLAQIPCDQTLIDTDAKILCDDNGPFVQVFVLRNDILPENVSEAQAGNYELTLTGQPYEPVGPVRTCEPPCESPTTPISTTGLCLADGTPIATVAQRDCAGVVTQTGWINLVTGVHTAGVPPVGSGACAPEPCDSPTTPIATTGLCLPDGTPIATVAARDCAGVITQTGWINLRTGLFTPGVPPAGAIACGAGQSIQVSGVFCDTDPVTGEVFALVLVEYHYDELGAIESVRLVLAADGTTYVLQGELALCPAGDAGVDVETEALCLYSSTGTLIQQVTAEYGYDATGLRVFGRLTDPTTGAVVVPPVGATVADCGVCVASSTHILCDSTPQPVPISFSDTDPVIYYQPTPPDTTVKQPWPGGGQALWDGAPLVIGGPAEDVDNTHRYVAAIVNPDSECPPCGAAGDVEVTATVTIRNDGPTAGGPISGRFHLHIGATQIAGDTAVSVPVGGTDTLTVTTIVPWENLSARQVAIVLDVETRATGGGLIAWTAQDFAFTATTVNAGCGTQFLRRVNTNCDTGALISVTDTTLDGLPYVVTGAAAACLDPNPCGPRTLICYAGSGAGENCEQGVQQQLPPISPTIESASVAANPNGFAVTALSASFNGVLTDWANINTDSAAPISAIPGLVLRYDFAAPGDIARILLWNNYGFDTNDADGLGAATLTVFDAADVQLFQGPLATGNGGAPFVTTFGGVIEDAAYFTLSDLTALRANPTVGFREIAVEGTYRTLITWDCPNETISALVEGTLPGITYDGANVVQTNPPHTFTFSSSVGTFAATIVTNNPAAWTTLDVSNAAPVTVLSQSASLSIQSVPSVSRGISSGWLAPDGTVTDVNTGLVVEDPLIVPCVTPPEADHVTTGHILELCEAGHSFLRHVRVTRDGVVLVTDTEIDGRTPYVVGNPVAVTDGPCMSQRLSDACAELGPQLQPSELVGFAQVGDCLVAQAANPTVTYTGAVDSLEFSTVGTIAGGQGFVLLLDGVTAVNVGDFTPPIPGFPGTVGDEYTGTATVGGFTIEASVVNGSLSSSGNFGLAGRMRFTFSPTLASVEIITNYGPPQQICDLVILPSTAPDPQPLAAYRGGDGEVTYFAVDGTEIDDPVLLPCGACCGDTPQPVQARGRLVPAAGPAWTPGTDVTGAALQVTATGITGTWTVTDAAGTVQAGLPAGVAFTWTAPDGDPLAPPQSIAAEPGGSVAVTWTER